jgi:hypothetical protein
LLFPTDLLATRYYRLTRIVRELDVMNALGIQTFCSEDFAGDFVYQLQDVLYATESNLGYFGYFCALEPIGTVKPEVRPPINGRIGKALRFLGFDVGAE